MNIKNVTEHNGRKPTPLTYCLRSLQGQFCGTHFLIYFLKLFREMKINFITLILFLPERFSYFLDLNRRYFLDHEKLCSQRVSYSLFFPEILLLYYLCKKSSYSFMRLAMFYLNHLYSKTLDVSIINWDWPNFF